VNVVGLKRHNFSSETIACLSEAHRLLFRTKVGVENAREILRSKGLLVPAVNHLLAFMEGLALGRHGRSRDRRQAA
jgi:UDP-N-acetylglucosamine acyltransferase